MWNALPNPAPKSPSASQHSQICAPAEREASKRDTHEKYLAFFAWVTEVSCVKVVVQACLSHCAFACLSGMQVWDRVSLRVYLPSVSEMQFISCFVCKTTRGSTDHCENHWKDTTQKHNLCWLVNFTGRSHAVLLFFQWMLGFVCFWWLFLYIY